MKCLSESKEGEAISQESGALLAALPLLAAVKLRNYCFDNFKNTSNVCSSSIRKRLAVSEG